MTKLEERIDYATQQVDGVIDVLTKRLVEIRNGIPGAEKLPDDLARMQDALKRLDTVTMSTADVKQVYQHLYELRRTLTMLDLTAT